jgi:hypothetical protein
MASKKKIGIEYVFPVTIVSLLGVFFIIMVVLSFAQGTIMKLYKDIGATPWKKPKTEITVPESELHSRDDIMSAVEATKKLYEDEWYTYNGAYLMQLSYCDELNELKKDENSGEWIYLGATMYTGYGSDVSEADKGKYHEAYWAVEKQPDGSWVCHGCAPINESKQLS